MIEVHEDCFVVQFLFSYFLNLFLMRLHLYLENVMKNLFCCIVAFQTQSTGNKDDRNVAAQ